MLKFKIDTDTYSTLDDNVKALYTQTADGYQLEVDGVADPAEVERLRAHNEKVLAEKKAQQEQAKQAEADKLKAEQEAALKAGDFEKYKITKDAELEQERLKTQELIRQRDLGLIESMAQKIAGSLSDDPKNQKILTNHIIPQRLTVKDDAVQIFDKSGNVIEETALINEFKASGDYDSLITGTKASGTGGTGSSNPINKSAGEYTEAERMELHKTNPQLFNQLFK